MLEGLVLYSERDPLQVGLLSLLSVALLFICALCLLYFARMFRCLSMPMMPMKARDHS